jgi:hypothetical protein
MLFLLSLAVRALARLLVGSRRWDPVAFDGYSPTLEEIATLDLAPG